MSLRLSPRISGRAHKHKRMSLSCARGWELLADPEQLGGLDRPLFDNEPISRLGANHHSKHPLLTTRAVRRDTVLPG